MQNFLLLTCCLVLLTGCSSGRQFAALDDHPDTNNEAVVAAGQAMVSSLIEKEGVPSQATVKCKTVESNAVKSNSVEPTSVESDLAQDPVEPVLRLTSHSEESDFIKATASKTASGTEAQLAAMVIGPLEPITESLSLVEAERLALAYNPTLVQLQNQITASRGQWVQGGLKPNPVLNLTSQEIGNEGSAGQNGASLSQTIVTANKLGLNRKVSAWDIRGSQLQLQIQRQRLMTDIRKQFYVTAIAQQRIAVSERLLSIAAQGEEQARRLVQVQEPLTVLKQAQVEAQLARIQVQNAQIQAQAEWSNLTTLIGQPTLVNRDLLIDQHDIDHALDFEFLLQEILSSSPEKAAAVAAQERAAWAVQRACAGATPNLQIQGGAFHDDSTNDSFANVQLSIPLTVHNVNQGRILEARANLASARANVRKVELQIRQRLITAVQQYESAMQQWETYEKQILPTAKQNLELTKAAFLSGDASYLPVLTAQRSFTQVELASLQAQQQLGIAKALIDGKLLEGSL